MIDVECANAVFIAGDISHGDLDDAKSLLEIIGRSGVPVFFVPGNMDSPKLSTWSRGSLKNLHGRCESFDSYLLVGLGGSVSTPFSTPFELTEEDAEKILNGTYTECKNRKLIFLSHNPPKNTDLDMTRPGIHVGSSSVRDFIDHRNPLLVICGHIHEAQGIHKISETTIVNPGPAYRGGYARIDLDDKIQVDLARLQLA